MQCTRCFHSQPRSILACLLPCSMQNVRIPFYSSFCNLLSKTFISRLLRKHLYNQTVLATYSDIPNTFHCGSKCFLEQSSLFLPNNNIKTRRHKGPHIVHLSTMCHLLTFDGSARSTSFVY